MLTLIRAEILRNRLGIVAPIIANAIVSALTALAFYFLISVNSPRGIDQLAAGGPRAANLIQQLTVFLFIAGVIVPGLVTLVAVAAASVERNRTSYARWRLIGASPRQVSVLVLAQFGLGALIASLAGALIAIPFLGLGSRYLLSVTDFGVDLTVAPSLSGLLWTMGLSIAVTLIGAAGPALRIGRIEPIAAIRVDQHVRVRMTWFRWTLSALALFACALTAASAISESSTGPASSAVLLSGVFLLIGLATAAPVIVPRLTLFWSAIVPARVSAAWYLARHQAAHRISSTTAAVVPLGVAVGLFAVYFGAAATWEQAVGASATESRSNALQGLVLFAPAGVIGICGSLAVLLLASKASQHEGALVRSIGARRSDLIWLPVLECVIHTCTALLLGFLASVLSTLVYSVSLVVNTGTWTFVVNPVPSLALAGIGFVFLAATLAIPRLITLAADGIQDLGRVG
ncbi:FtsX-like permease family protein [Leifsonia sp. NPDC056824]|uniref:FtsX-like permease family protein n=1 Tax=Leifsonia sp. NPDC056824 TaxID=3345953 RepID=UPI00369F9088